jgi:hypothetical protein
MCAFSFKAGARCISAARKWPFADALSKTPSDPAPAPPQDPSDFSDAAHPLPPGAAAGMPENATRPAGSLHAMEELHAVAGADGLALVMSIEATAEHESVQGAASMCSAMRARSTRCFTHWLRVRSRGPHSTRPCYASHARRSASHFSSHCACSVLC